MAKPRNLILCITLFSLNLITTLASNPQISGVTSHEHHKNTKDSIGVYELKKGNLSIKLTNYGATVISLILPDKYGKLGDVVLGYETVKEYVNDATYFGAIVGRVANRIAGAQFTYNGVHYMLVPNEGKNIIHGGPKGFSRVIWKVDKYSPDVPSPFVTFSYYSVDGEQDMADDHHTTSSRIMGSGSNSDARDREAEDQPSGPPAPPVIPEEARIYLSSQPGGVWWEDKSIVNLLGRSFTDTYHEYVTCWSDASPRQRDAMYLFFAAHVRVDAGYNLRAAYQSRIKPRITVTINRVAKNGKKPTWMPIVCFERLMKRHLDPNWTAKAGKAKANRLKGGKEGKGPPTSSLGQQSATRAFKDLGADAQTPYGLLCKSKKNKKGEWITPRAEQVDAEYQRLRQLHDPEGQMTEDDNFKTYLEAAGGFDKKTRVFGLGTVARELFVPPTSSSRSSTSSQTSYTPSLISQYATKNAELETRLSQLQTEYAAERARAEEDRRLSRAMREKLAEQFGWTFDVTETCSTPPPYQRRDDATDGGSGPSGMPDLTIMPLA